MLSKKEDHHISKVLDNLFNTVEITENTDTVTSCKPVRNTKQAIKQGFKLAKPVTAKQRRSSVANATYDDRRSNIAIPKPKKVIGKPKDSIAVLEILDLGLLVRYNDRLELSLRQVRTVKKSIHDAIVIDLLIDIDRLAIDTLQAIQNDPDLSFYSATKIAVTMQFNKDKIGNSLFSLQSLAVVYSIPMNKLYKALVNGITHIMQPIKDKSIHALPLTIDV